MYIKSEQDWKQQQSLLLESLHEFSAVLTKRPFDNREGLRGLSAFALYWFIQQINPTVVFEVGVWKGFSTWIIQQAAPNARIVSFDPMFMLEGVLDPRKIRPTYRDKSVTYLGEDFSCADVPRLIDGSKRPLVFFDDHQNKLPRLLQARAYGIGDVIFDDNTPFDYTHRTLEHERKNKDAVRLLEAVVERYEIFPALWPVDFQLTPTIRIKERGIEFPVTPELNHIYKERHWHSYVTYLRLAQNV